ncbi:TPA: hypothetical protein QCJ55_003085 [Enterobacter ludwigii]|nr:hypothetical protein [Enterobacter ludwigii]
MIQLNLARVLLLGTERNGYIRYEIFSKEGEDPQVNAAGSKLMMKSAWSTSDFSLEGDSREQ